jgi:hypothetical protein
MPNRLEPVNLVDFTGGLNLRSNQFQLTPNESPEMVNINIDPLGGFYTRLGWERWNEDDIVDVETVEWDPRRAFLHQLSDGSDVVYVAASGGIYWAREDAVFAGPLPPVAEADPHMADFAAWGDDLYVSVGHTQPMWRRTGVGTMTSLTPGGSATWNDEYTAPAGTVGPQAEVNEPHGGYLFAANTQEDGLWHPNRVRWSHPNRPDNWASTDYIDIGTGGSQITGMMSYEDHLLIFKNDSMWALYGYDLDSWQLVQKSSTIGAVSPQGITRNEATVFFFSASDRGGIYAYGGERSQEISIQLRRAFFEILHPDLVWVGWIGRKLYVTLPWNYAGPTANNYGVFVFDPSVGDGAWTFFHSTHGSIGPIVAHSNVDSQPYPLAVVRETDTACVVQLMKINDAYDKIHQEHSLGTSTGGYLVTDTDAEILLTGEINHEPFDTVYRTPWITAEWPTRKKSWRRPDFVCRETGFTHQLAVRSYRDYEETQPKRQYSLQVPSTGAEARWGAFTWGDGTIWGAGKSGASIRRGSSFGMCRALQLRVAGATPLHRWGVDAIILKIVLRRFR